VKSNDSAAVWYVSGGIRKVVPSYNSFVLLGLNASSVDTVNGATLTSLTDSGILLASGQLVKTPDSAGVYVVSNGNRIAYNSSDIFESYKNNWSNIETYSSIQLDANYPISGSAVPRVLADKTSGKSYIINNGVCYSLSDSTLTAIGTTNSTIATSQPYDASIFRYINLSSCIQSNNFIKSSDSSLVYWLSAGQKHPLTYNAMLNRNNGISPMVMVGDSNFVNAITAGTMLSQ
jgi:hypothetical protein